MEEHVDFSLMVKKTGDPKQDKTKFLKIESLLDKFQTAGKIDDWSFRRLVGERLYYGDIERKFGPFLSSDLKPLLSDDKKEEYIIFTEMNL